MEGKSAKNRKIPVLQEELQLGKRTVETGVTKVSVAVRETEEVVELPLMQEKVAVRRVAVDRFLDRPAETRTEGDVTIIPVMEEVLVVEKRLLLKEEIHITLRKETVMHTRKETLRKEEATVEHTDRR